MLEPEAGATLDRRIADLEAENEILKRELRNAWLIIYRPGNEFLSPEPWRRHMASLGLLRGCQ